jgi:hypothetical protein
MAWRTKKGPEMTVTVRGKEYEVTIDHDGGYEEDTNAHVIEWHFDDLTPAEHNKLNLSDDEEQSIFEQLREFRGGDAA